MSFQHAFKLASYLLILTGFLALYAAGGVGTPLAVVYLAAVAIGWREKVYFLPNWLQLILVLSFLAVFFLDASFVSGFVAATVHLLILIGIVKLLTWKGERDYLLLYFLSFAFLLMASTFTISPVFLGTLVAYVFFAILTFILFESKAAYEENRAAEFSVRGYVSTTLLMTGLILLVSVPIFVTVPRTSLGWFKFDYERSENLSGFTDRVNLGDIGRIISNPTIVMRVAVDTEVERLPQDLKWRGIALDHYDGRVWSNTDRMFRRIARDERYRSFLVAEARRIQGEEFLVGQSILMEPLGTVIFGATDIVSIALEDASGHFLFEDANNSFSLARRPSEPLRYSVYSDVVERGQKLAQPVQGELTEPIRQRYLQLPEIDPRIVQLAEQITQGQGTDIGKALMIERFLKRGYGYSLENRSASAPDPLYDFLFRTRKGHCEYFATAQAVLMRALGVPARVVNGFRAGEFNRWGGYFIVRQSNAHSWVEGYFPGPGWVEFDPTPAESETSRSFLGQMVGQLLDTVDLFWNEVITFDRIKQVGFFQRLARTAEAGWGRIAVLSRDLENWRRWGRAVLTNWTVSSLVIPALALVLLLLGGTAYRFRRYLSLLWKRHILRRESSDLAPEYYLELLDVLGRRGYAKRPSETAAEFARRIAPELHHPGPAQITDLYYLNRFGNYPLRQKHLNEIYSLLRQLRS